MDNYEELAMHLTGFDPVYDDFDYDQVEELLYDKYSIDMEPFNKLVGELVNLINVGESPLTKKIYKGFGHDGFWLVKKEIK